MAEKQASAIYIQVLSSDVKKIRLFIWGVNNIILIIKLFSTGFKREVCFVYYNWTVSSNHFITGSHVHRHP